MPRWHSMNGEVHVNFTLSKRSVLPIHRKKFWFPNKAFLAATISFALGSRFLCTDLRPPNDVVSRRKKLLALETFSAAINGAQSSSETDWYLHLSPDLSLHVQNICMFLRRSRF